MKETDAHGAHVCYYAALGGHSEVVKLPFRGDADRSGEYCCNML